MDLNKIDINKINNSIDYSLNNVEMEAICQCRVLTYGELAKCKSLDDVFMYKGEPSDMVVICYLTKKNYGHWCCLFKNKTGNNSNKPQVEFFDSYGIKPDGELDWNIDEYFRRESNEDYPHLTWLLYQYTNSTGVSIGYNPYKFQSKDLINGKIVATCGRWVIVRLALKFLSDSQYRNIIEKCYNRLDLNGDQLVVALTQPYVQKP